ncbi:MAG: dihydrodipicolinate synthase family protein [Pirellulaceae bacterium]
MTAIRKIRGELVSKLFPSGIPRLWCPTLTHFSAPRKPDESRIRAHLESLSNHVSGILVPGSTGEGWEMSDADVHALLDIVLDAAQAAGIQVLIGVLKTDLDAMLSCLNSIEQLLTHPAIAGITVCPPKGSELSQLEIQDALARILQRGWPTALYQLPQVTLNAMSTETVVALSAQFPNFILFKDTSGEDVVAQSAVQGNLDLGGVWMVRGAEQGGYARWLRSAGGPYDGFLLSTANVFSPQLAEIQDLLDDGDHAAATALSTRLEAVVQNVFTLVRGFPTGNAFANANKLLDHCLAFGDEAIHAPPPLLYSGAQLPDNWVADAYRVLKQQSLLPTVGYWR